MLGNNVVYFDYKFWLKESKLDVVFNYSNIKI